MKTPALLLLLLISPARAQAPEASLVREVQPAPLDRDPMKTTIHQLKNGLSVYLSPNEQEPRITAWIAVRAGGAQDPADSTGMAHYLEHMLFKGSRRLGTLDYAAEKPHLDEAQRLYEELFKTKDPAKRKEIYKRIDEANQKASAYAVPNEMDKAYKSLGVRGVNAFTANERTVYVCDLPKNRLRAWARLEADRFNEPVFRLFQNEIETVYEEKNRSMDHPERIISEALDAALFPGHPYGRAILGTVEHLKNPSLAKMYAFYAKHYRPENMAIVLSGDFNREEALKVLEEEFAAWKGEAFAPQGFAAPAAAAKDQRVEVRYESEEKVVVAFPAVKEDHPDADALVVMDMLTDNSQAGLINLRLNQAQKLKQAGSYPSLLNAGGSWQLWGVPKDGQTLEQVEALLLEIVDSIKAGEFDSADMAAVIRDFEISHKAKLETNEGRAGVMADAFTGYRTWERQVDRIARLRAVTKDDVLRVAKKYLSGPKVTALRRKGKPEIPSIEKPEFAKLAIEPSRESAFLKEIVSIPAEEIMPRWLAEGRDYETLDASFGRLIAAKNPMNDLFALSFSYDRGRKHERSLCEALSLLELSGAGDLSADAFKKKLYGLGVKMS